MAEHRRVEPRGIVGTGMTTDPDRIREVEEDAERKKRAWRNAPEKGFGDVLEQAPSRGELADEDSDDPRDPRRRKKPELPAAAPSEAALAEAALAGDAAKERASASSTSPASTPAPVAQGDGAVPPEKSAKAALPKVPKDPREAMLRKMLEQNKNKPQNAFDVNTPPTGSRSRKPT